MTDMQERIDTASNKLAKYIPHLRGNYGVWFYTDTRKYKFRFITAPIDHSEYLATSEVCLPEGVTDDGIEYMLLDILIKHVLNRFNDYYKCIQ